MHKGEQMIFKRHKNIYKYTIEAQSEQERLYLTRLGGVFPPLDHDGDEWCPIEGPLKARHMKPKSAAQQGIFEDHPALLKKLKSH